MKKKILLIPIILILVIILSGIVFYNVGLKAVSSDKNKVEFIVEEGSTYYSVINKLKKQDLIKNELCFKVYIKLNNKNNIVFIEWM